MSAAAIRAAYIEAALLSRAVSLQRERRKRLGAQAPDEQYKPAEAH
jgi:hypothetical protein